MRHRETEERLGNITEAVPHEAGIALGIRAAKFEPTHVDHRSDTRPALQTDATVLGLHLLDRVPRAKLQRHVDLPASRHVVGLPLLLAES